MEHLESGAVTQSLTPPLIGEIWPGQGGIYMGLAAADGDLPQGHLVLCDVKAPKRMTWAAAVKWAKAQAVDGHTDLRLPTRFEAALIYANGRQHVDQTTWHWTGTPHESLASCAWDCYFGYGFQDYGSKDSGGTVRAVRRLNL